MFYGSATGIEFEHLVYDCSVCRMPFRPSDNGDDACPVHGDREPERRFKGHGQAFGSAVWRLECCGKMFLGSGDAGGDDDEAQIGLCRAAVEDGRGHVAHESHEFQSWGGHGVLPEDISKWRGGFMDPAEMIELMRDVEPGCSPAVEECTGRGYFHDEEGQDYDAAGEGLLEEINDLTWDQPWPRDGSDCDSDGGYGSY